VTAPAVERVTSRDNALLVKLRKLARDPAAYRKLGLVWLEGDHLCAALVARGGRPQQAVVSEAGFERHRALALAASRVVVLPDALFATFSALESPASIGFVLAHGEAPAMNGKAPSVVLDRLQDAGNVGSILRSAAAFGFAQVIALKGTAALWSPKVLRAGMGAHFGLRLVEGAEPEALEALAVPCVATSSHRGEWLHRARLPHPCAWLMGHEGQGLSAALEARASLQVRIAQPGGEESLNVAAAAAICLHASAAAAEG
jgi:TrmH family RNA methyltransferase